MIINWMKICWNEYPNCSEYKLCCKTGRHKFQDHITPSLKKKKTFKGKKRGHKKQKHSPHKCHPSLEEKKKHKKSNQLLASNPPLQ